MADKFKNATTIGMVVLLGIGLQVILAFSEMADSPGKAAVEFTKAYFKYDPAMKDRMCADLLEGGEGDFVAAYINRARSRAAERGFTLCYLGDGVKHITAKTISRDKDSAVLEIEATLKNSLRSFFTKEKAYEVHGEFRMVKEGDQWKVCGNPFMIAGADYVVAAAEEEAVEEQAVEEEAAGEEQSEGAEESSGEESEDDGESEHS